MCFVQPRKNKNSEKIVLVNKGFHIIIIIIIFFTVVVVELLLHESRMGDGGSDFCIGHPFELMTFMTQKYDFFSSVPFSEE